MDRDGRELGPRYQIRGTAPPQILCLQREQITIPCPRPGHQFRLRGQNHLHAGVQGRAISGFKYSTASGSYEHV